MSRIGVISISMLDSRSRTCIQTRPPRGIGPHAVKLHVQADRRDPTRTAHAQMRGRKNRTYPTVPKWLRAKSCRHESESRSILITLQPRRPTPASPFASAVGIGELHVAVAYCHITPHNIRRGLLQVTEACTRMEVGPDVRTQGKQSK